jgi:RNA polymerase sigma factor (sigma-70 family)
MLGRTPLCTALRHARAAAAPDAELLHAWLSRHDDAAFAALVRRHGSMVLNVCRRILHHRQDAEDAFQATFLLLARKAGSVRERAALAAWLHGTAYRMALSVRRAAARRRAHEGRVRAPGPQGPSAEVAWREVQALLEEEVQRLPEKCRTVFVLCCLESKGRAEVARLLGLREGTVSSRLDQARKRLRERLARRGVTLAGVLAAAAVAGPSGGEAALFAATARAAGGAVPPRVAALVDGALPATFAAKKLAAALALTLALLAGGVGALACRGPAAGPDEGQAPPQKPERPRPPEGPAARADRYGDALPAGAVARLGTVRFRHGSLVTGLAFAPDGKTLVSASYDKTLRVWDAATGRELRRLPPFRGSLAGLSASADGRTVAVCEYGWEAFLADTATGRVTPLRPQPGAFRVCVALSPDGKLLAVGASSIRLWDAAAGKPLREWRGHSGQVRRLAFAPDGKALASGDDTSARLWEAATGKELLRLGVGSPVRALAFSPDGKALATGSEDGRLRLWELPSGKRLHESPAQGLPVRAAAFSPDGKVVASGVNGLVTLWDAAVGKELRRLWGAGAEAVAFSPDGATLATGGNGGTIRLWDVRTGKERPLAAAGHQGMVRTVAVSRDGTLAATGGGDRLVRLWALPSGKEARRIDAASTWFVGAVALSPDGRTVATDKGLWDTATGRFRPGREGPRTAFRGQDYSVEAIAFAPDGKTVAMATRDAESGKGRMIRRRDAVTGREVGGFGTERVRALAYAPDGKALAAGNEDGSITLWDVAAGRELRRIAGHRREVNSVAFAPDGRLLASSSFDGDLFLWGPATGKQVRRLVRGEGRRAGPVNVLAVAFSPEGRMLASAEEPFSSALGASVTLWEVATGQVRRRLAGHEGDVNSLAFAGDGRTLVSGSTDTTALVWDLAAPPSKQGPDELWADLLAPDGARAWRAMCTLAASPAGVKFLGRALPPVPRLRDEARTARLVKALDGDDFQERETATRELATLGEAVEPALRRALEGRPSAEARRRLEGLLAGDPAERLRTERTLEALELSRLAEAEQVLEALAKGNPEARRTREAKAALERRRVRRP